MPTCNPSAGQTLNGVPVNGVCVLSVYYCSASNTPFGQTPPTGYASVPSSPGGCDYNQCPGGTPPNNCQQNFCKDAQGVCPCQ